MISVIIPISDLHRCRHRADAFFYVRDRVREMGDVELVIVEQEQTAGEREIEVRPHERFVPVHIPGTFNKARLCNVGASVATGETLLFLDADVCLAWSAVRRGLDRLQPGEVLKPFRHVVRLTEGQTASVYAGATVRAHGASSHTDVLCGGAFGIRREDWEAAGCFDERFAGGPLEDTELGRRLAARLRVVALPQRAYHLWHPPAKRSARVAARNLALLRKRATRYTPAERPAVVCVLRTGGSGSREYTADIARWLFRQVRRQVVNDTCTFICLTDDKELLQNAPFYTIPLRHDWPGWWSKIELFRPHLFDGHDAVLFLDLDTVLPKPFSVPKTTPGDFRMLRAFTGGKDGWMSGVMLWHPQTTLSGIYTDFVDHADQWQWCCRLNAGGDQQYIAFHQLLNGREIERVDELIAVERFENVGDLPDADIVCWWGAQKPWNSGHKRFCPPMRAGRASTALVGAWFGTMEDSARLAAAIEGLKHWTELDPMPQIVVIDASPTGNDIPEIEGVTVLRIRTGPEHQGLWQKEALWNKAARHVLEQEQAPAYLMFADLDCYWSGGLDVVALAEDSLSVGRLDVLQPFGHVVERDPDGNTEAFTSYALQKLQGQTGIKDGQGFALAMTATWFERVGGFPEESIEGGGDAVTCLRWDADPAHSRSYQERFADWGQLSACWGGPRTSWGCVPVAMRHVWHGARRGNDTTRHYHSRHYVWEICGGRHNVVERDPDTGLWRWKDTPEAEAVRHIRTHQADYTTEQAVREAYEGMLAPDRFLTRNQFMCALESDPTYYCEARWTYYQAAVDYAKQCPGRALEIGPYRCPVVRRHAVYVDRFDTGLDGLHVIDLDRSALPFEPDSFGVAIALEVLEHLAEPARVLRDMLTVAPAAVVSIPWNWTNGDRMHTRVNEGLLVQWIADAGNADEKNRVVCHAQTANPILVLFLERNRRSKVK